MSAKNTTFKKNPFTKRCRDVDLKQINITKLEDIFSTSSYGDIMMYEKPFGKTEMGPLDPLGRWKVKEHMLPEQKLSGKKPMSQDPEHYALR